MTREPRTTFYVTSESNKSRGEKNEKNRRTLLFVAKLVCNIELLTDKEAAAYVSRVGAFARGVQHLEKAKVSRRRRLKPRSALNRNRRPVVDFIPKAVNSLSLFYFRVRLAYRLSDFPLSYLEHTHTRSLTPTYAHHFAAFVTYTRIGVDKRVGKTTIRAARNSRNCGLLRKGSCLLFGLLDIPYKTMISDKDL